MKNKEFKKYLLISFLIHLSISLSFFNFIPLFKKDLRLDTAVRVDMLDLPDLPSKKKVSKKRKVKKKPKPLPVKKKPTKKLEKKKKEEPKVAKKEEKSKDEEFQEEVAQEIEKNEELNETEDQKRKGNQISEGADEGSNEISEEQLEEINIYASQVESLIRSSWNLPKYLIELDLEAQIEIKISDLGQITFIKLNQSSGNEVFDSHVLKAVESVAPYPIPPFSIQRLLKDGIVFSLNSKN